MGASITKDKTTTLLAELVASHRDPYGYITYIFQNLDFKDDDDRYVMCTRYPNWQVRDLKLGDKGFLTVLEIVAGEDKWFNGTKMIPYTCSTVQFLKFVDLPIQTDGKFIIN